MPARRFLFQAELLVYLLIASLGMAFVAGLIGFVVIRANHSLTIPVAHTALPQTFWLATGLLLLGSWSLHCALMAARREHQFPLRQWLLTALVAGVGFAAVQADGLKSLVQRHQQTLENGDRTPPLRMVDTMRSSSTLPASKLVQRSLSTAVWQSWGLIGFMLAFHALHFVVGLMLLAIVVWRGFQGRFDHEYHLGLKLCAIYWHFLDVIWLVMMAVFLVVT
jgi:cytochrome c oxidase subunit III